MASSRNEAIMEAILSGSSTIGEPYTDPPQSRTEDLLLQIKAMIEAGGGGGGTGDYDKLLNLPTVNGNKLEGEVSGEFLELVDKLKPEQVNELLAILSGD
jgi:hypothetical protein